MGKAGLSRLDSCHRCNSSLWLVFLTDRLSVLASAPAGRFRLNSLKLMSLIPSEAPGIWIAADLGVARVVQPAAGDIGLRRSPPWLTASHDACASGE